MQKMSKLDRYVNWKSKLQMENYLKRGDATTGKNATYTQLRCGMAKLRIHTGTQEKLFRERAERICLLCASGEVEDEKHLLFNCAAYRYERDIFYESVCACTGGKVNPFNRFAFPQQPAMQILMGKSKVEHPNLTITLKIEQQAEIQKIVRGYVNKCMKIRDRMMRDKKR